MGLVSVAILAPNALQLLKGFGVLEGKKKKYRNGAQLRYNINATISRLEKEGCLTVEENEDGTWVRLTKKGQKRLASYQASGISKQNPRIWDGKWRVIIFDVAEDKRAIRDKLRRELRNYGFVRLQQSVWVVPFDCEDFISILKTDQKLWSEVLYIVADKIEGERHLRKTFNLS